MNFLIATHGKLAEGFYDSIKFFNNSVDNVYYINAYIDEVDFEQIFLNQIAELCTEDLIVFTDLPGGTVNRVVSRYIPEYNYQVFSGINLPLILEIVFKGELMSASEIQEIIHSSKEQLVHMNSALEAYERGDQVD